MNFIYPLNYHQILMELRQIRFFVGVCEAGSLLKAAAQLHVAQPWLSQQMAQLEQELGAQLLVRSNRGVTPTDAGKLFLEHARILLQDAARARQAVREMDTEPKGEVALGLPTTIALIADLPILQACREQLPQIKLKVVEAYSGHLREWLQTGRLDLALLFGTAPEPGLSKTPLLDDRLGFVTSATGGRKLPKMMGTADAVRWPMVLPGKEHGLRRIINEVFHAELASLDVVAEIESLGSVKRAAEAGIGSTILPLAAVTAEVAAGKLRTALIDSPAMSRRVVCAVNTERPISSAAGAVNQLVRHVIKDMVTTGRWPATSWLGG